MRQRYRGFTLIEILIVIGLLMLLMGLFAPALVRAQEQARRLKCLNNMSQIGKAMLVYAFKNDGELPGNKNDVTSKKWDGGSGTIDWDSMYKRYGQPNDLLVRLNIYEFTVKDVPITPVYGVGEQSGIRPLRMIPRLAWLLWRLFWYRMLHRYVIRDFHPLVFFYLTGSALFAPGTLLGAYLFIKRILMGPIASTSAMFAMFLVVTGLQLLLFAMWMDMEYNKELR